MEGLSRRETGAKIRVLACLEELRGCTEYRVQVVERESKEGGSTHHINSTPKKENWQHSGEELPIEHDMTGLWLRLLGVSVLSHSA